MIYENKIDKKNSDLEQSPFQDFMDLIKPLSVKSTHRRNKDRNNKE
jgi:hypothetical protein